MQLGPGLRASGLIGRGEHGDDEDEPDSALGKKCYTHHALTLASESRSNDLGQILILVFQRICL